MTHKNDGKCEKCLSIIARYPDFYEPMKLWFVGFQANHPEAHVSEAGRGKEMQNIFYRKGASKARYGESAHNYNCALDLFEMSGKLKDIYEFTWFVDVLRPNLPSWIIWYGEPSAVFREYPHIEVKNWKALVRSGLVNLVEKEDEEA